MNHFLFLVKSKDKVLGYDSYDAKKQIVNYTIKPGYYLAFYEKNNFKVRFEDDLIYFIYESKVLMIRKKIAFSLSV